MNVSKAIFEGRNIILGVPNGSISDSGASDSNAKTSRCFPKVNTDPHSLDDSRHSLIVHAEDKNKHIQEIYFTSAAIKRSLFLKSFFQERTEETPYFPRLAENLQDYLNNIEQPLSDTPLTEEGLLDLIKTADYLADDALVRDANFIFWKKIAEFTQEKCLTLICSIQSYPQSGGIREAEGHLMRRLSTIIKHYSDEEILKVFESLKRPINILNLSNTKISSKALEALDKLFPHLEELNIAGTEVTEIPSGGWKNLKKLNATCCKRLTSIGGLKDTDIKEINISGSGLTEIAYGRWEKLEKLEASECKSLTSIEGLKDSGIKNINISGSSVTEIPSGKWLEGIIIRVSSEISFKRVGKHWIKKHD